jgi:hypothetical protein
MTRKLFCSAIAAVVASASSRFARLRQARGAASRTPTPTAAITAP